MAETMICPKCGCDVTEVMTVQLEAKIRSDLALEWRDREAEWKQKQAPGPGCASHVQKYISHCDFLATRAYYLSRLGGKICLPGQQLSLLGL